MNNIIAKVVAGVLVGSMVIGAQIAGAAPSPMGMEIGKATPEDMPETFLVVEKESSFLPGGTEHQSIHIGKSKNNGVFVFNVDDILAFAKILIREYQVAEYNSALISKYQPLSYQEKLSIEKDLQTPYSRVFRDGDVLICVEDKSDGSITISYFSKDAYEAKAKYGVERSAELKKLI